MRVNSSSSPAAAFSRLMALRSRCRGWRADDARCRLGRHVSDTACAASISIQPDSCTDRSRSGISEALTAPSTNSAWLPAARGDLGGAVPERGEQRQVLDGLPVVPCRLRGGQHQLAGGVAGRGVVGVVARQRRGHQREVARKDPVEQTAVAAARALDDAVGSHVVVHRGDEAMHPLGVVGVLGAHPRVRFPGRAPRPDSRCTARAPSSHP